MNSLGNKLQNFISIKTERIFKILPPKIKNVTQEANKEVTTLTYKHSQRKVFIFWKINSSNFLSRQHVFQDCHLKNSKLKFSSSWTTSAKGHNFDNKKKTRKTSSRKLKYHRLSGQFSFPIRFIEFKNINTISYKTSAFITSKGH